MAPTTLERLVERLSPDADRRGDHVDPIVWVRPIGGIS